MHVEVCAEIWIYEYDPEIKWVSTLENTVIIKSERSFLKQIQMQSHAHYTFYAKSVSLEDWIPESATESK